MIKGVSGSGKSTLLRAISGIWPFVDGKIFLPERDKLMFIPQKSYLPLGTLRAALNYPGNKPIDDTELIYLMDLCQIGYLKDKLDLEADWSHVLSVGEQQRLAFVRAHIQQPQWLSWMKQPLLWMKILRRICTACYRSVYSRLLL